MASIIKNIEYIKKHFDVHFEFVINKINEDGISLSGKSSEYVSKIVYPIVNYIDFVNNGDTDNLKNLSINEITNLYYKWIDVNKNKFITKNYIENHKIILDYRIDNTGFYWVDLNCYYSAEILFRLNNCGRVNSYQNFLELREYDLYGYNFSRVFVVIDSNGKINQIKGYKNTKPNKIYSKYIFDLFMNYDKISGFKFIFGKQNDFTLNDLNKNEINLLKSKKPELFSLEII